MLAEQDLLSPFVHGGLVDYARLRCHLDMREVALEIARTDLSGASRNEQLSFYLNAYNLLVIHQVVERLTDFPQWPGVLSLAEKLRFFVLRKHAVAGSKLSLMALENRVIRERFAEPRIHFALNCASMSCPPLPRQLFAADTLESDLERLTTAFIRSDAVREVHGSRRSGLDVSPIFKWYRKDFRPSVPTFISSYRPVPDDARLSYQEYDWSLNRCDSISAAKKQSAA